MYSFEKIPNYVFDILSEKGADADLFVVPDGYEVMAF